MTAVQGETLGTGLSGCSRQAYLCSLRLARVCGHLRRPLLLPQGWQAWEGERWRPLPASQQQAA